MSVRRLSGRHVAAAVTAFAVLAATAQPAAAAVRHPLAQPQQAQDAAKDPVLDGLRGIVAADGWPGALASVEARGGRTRDLVAGVAQVGTHRAVPVDGQVRIGSNTKTFVSVVVLQLVAEKKVVLDAPVETYLPGLLRGDGIDGRKITVRQLLQHTSGLPNYTDYLELEDETDLHRYFEPRDLLDAALAHPAIFAPGTSWSYSNTNYVVAGLLVEKVTGRPIIEEVTRRVIARAGLKHTYFPPVGEEVIRERHPNGYTPEDTGKLLDVTDLDPSWGWAAGQMVGTPSDLNKFFTALLDGKLMPAAQLAEMKKTVETIDFIPGARYGLGLMGFPLTCGGLAWGHGGDIPGYETRGGVAGNGRAVQVAVTSLPSTEDQANGVMEFVDMALCATK
ncbi:serine hydrolase domain-containing protein [Winogradskya humida]|uniref:Serine hydrolase n=1 Tax=Winogradskya humida TaxID=113566 RepID=A0ABQ3ZKV7_9ACTN|nr:serine hydrolase domain-containing protein [Actinoplanes humidus]GIE19231.1 serine hydrolase [Actinoplanes humidus]